MAVRNLVVSMVILAVACGVGPRSAGAQPQSGDHPLISRFPGAEIVKRDVKEFDDYLLILGPYQKGKFTKTQKLEGKVTRIHYKDPANRAGLEIIRSYQQALENAGFTTLFSCAGAECGEGVNDDNEVNVGRWCIGGLDCPEPMRYTAAKLARPEGDVYVAVKVLINDPKRQFYNSRAGTSLSVIEVKPMQAGLVAVNAAALATEIARQGHASVYGILFDTGKADIKPESKTVLDEIAKLLTTNAALQLHVVGHTDSVGTIESNMTLSQRRADAVVKALSTTYGVAPARLRAAGVGPLAPVASNSTEEGKAKNRRVELVER